jgi:hypothetical protein
MLLKYPWLKPALIALGVLVLSGLIVGLFVKDQEVQHVRKAQSEKHVQVATNSVTTEQLNSVITQFNSAISTLNQKQASTEARQSDLNQKVSRETIRYIQSPQNAPGAPPQPIVIHPGSAGPSSPQPVIVAPPGTVSGVPVEIVREIIETIDKSRTDASTSTETQANTTATGTTTATASGTATTETTAKIDTTEKSSVTEKEATKPAQPAASERLGVGVLSTGSPFVSFDVTSLNLGPTDRLSLGKLGLGFYGAKSLSSGGSLDFGPEINYQPKKTNLFGMVGYSIPRKEPVFGVGIKWKF